MIRVEELTKIYFHNEVPFAAVDRISFCVEPGEVYGLLGPNGAGKSTTIRMILGLLPPDGGFAEVGGFRSSRSPDEVKRRIGFVSASAGIYQSLTAREMLLFFCEVYGIQGDHARERVHAVSAMLDCQRFLDQRCSTLSTGQKQRVNLARAMVHDPPVMLLDEPTLGLDVIGSQVVFNYMHQVQNAGKSIILCTHSLEQAERVCSRFGLLHRGVLWQEGTLEELRARTGCETLVDMFLATMNQVSSRS